MERKKNSTLLSLTILLLVASASSVVATNLPLLHRSDFVYRGAFRLPADDYGSSNLNYSEGPLAVSSNGQSIFIVGHSHHQNIAEFAIPPLVGSTVLSQLNMAGAPLQTFTPVLERASTGNPQALDRIGGLYHFAGSEPQLVVNAYEYYDADNNSSQTTLVARNSAQLATCTMDGFHTFQGGAGHTSGWISPIPNEWRTALGGDHLAGQSSGMPIISRFSVGPSAFAFAIDNLTGPTVPNPVPTIRLLDFSLEHPLHSDLANDSRTNTLWTHLSRVVFGMVVPGSRTYLTLGYSGGHSSGVCYKCVPEGSSEACGGYCARHVDDYALYYWLWDLNDLLAVKNGTQQPYAPRPYEHGEFVIPFATNELGGGSYDPSSNTLYLTVQRADLAQGEYNNPPVVVAFTFIGTRRSSGIIPGLQLLLE